MRKLFFTSILIALCATLSAQMYVWKNGNVDYMIPLEDLDSITFRLFSDSILDDSIVLPEGTVYLQALNSQYATGVDMGYSEAVTHNFLLIFATDECEVVQGSPFGSGDVLVLELYSATAENILPAEGIYKIGDEIKDGAICAGFEFSEIPLGTYLRHMVDDEFVGTDYIVAGGVEIKKTDKPNELEFIIYVVFEDGSEGYYYYKGELLIDNLSSAE